MRHETIPITLLLEYLRACQPVVALVSDQLRPYSQLSESVMPLIAALTALDTHLRRYQRTGTWAGPPPFLAEYAVEPLEPAQAIDPEHAAELVPFWASRSLI